MSITVEHNICPLCTTITSLIKCNIIVVTLYFYKAIVSCFSHLCMCNCIVISIYYVCQMVRRSSTTTSVDICLTTPHGIVCTSNGPVCFVSTSLVCVYPISRAIVMHALCNAYIVCITSAIEIDIVVCTSLLNT